MSSAPFFRDVYHTSFSTIPPSTTGGGPSHHETTTDIRSSMLLILLGGIIFITLISLYEIVRVWLVYRFTIDELDDSGVPDTKKEEIIITERATLSGTILFALFTVSIFGVVGVFIIKYLSRNE